MAPHALSGSVEQLVERHLDYASSLARKIHRQLPAHVEFEELEQYARLGLVEAAGRFDPTHGAQFTTFAYYRIRGAVFDGLRRMTGVPPSVFEQAREQELADAALSEALESSEGCQDEDALASMFETAVTHVAFVQLASNLGDEGGFDPADPNDHEDEFERSDAVRRLRSLLAGLEPAERELLSWLYGESLSMSECGARLGLDKAQICRRHARILTRLRAHMGPA